MIIAKHSRRSFLRLGLAATAGAAVGFRPFLGRAAVGPKPKRIIFCVSPHGFVHGNLDMIPAGFASGDAFEHDLRNATLSPILSPLDAFKERLLVLDGVSMNSAIADYWRARNPHVPAHLHVLTGANSPVRDNAGAGGAPSVDQIIAEHYAGDVPYRSVEVGFAASGGGLGLGAYNWSGANSALPYLYEPSALFDYLFASFEAPGNVTMSTLEQRIARFATDEHAALLSRHTGASAERLSTHRDLLAALADRLASVGSMSCVAPRRPDQGASYARRYADHAQVIAAAFACDLTRVATIAFTDQDASDCGGAVGTNLHNDYAHDTTDRNPMGGNEQADGVMTQASVNHAGHIATLLEALDSYQEPDGTSLLDSTMVVWTSELACGRHNGSRAYSDLPFIIAGGGDALKLGRYVSYAENHATPYCAERGPTPDQVGPSHNQLLVSLCHAMGLSHVNAVGVESVPLADNTTLDCTGPLPGLV